MKKYVSVILISIVTIFMFSTIVLADDPISAMNGYQNSGNNAKLSEIGSKIYGIILVVGSAVALGGLSIMGVKFMTAAPTEKADIKKNLIGFTIGVIILICAVGLLTIFKNIGEEITAQAYIQYNNIKLG